MLCYVYSLKDFRSLGLLSPTICPTGVEDTDPARDQEPSQSLTRSIFHFKLLGTTHELKQDGVIKLCSLLTVLY